MRIKGRVRGGESIAIIGIFMAVLQEGVSIFPERDLSSRRQIFLRIFTVMTLVITVQIKLDVPLVRGIQREVQI